MNLLRDLKGTLEPFGVTLRNLFRKPVTIQYPEEKRTPYPRYRARMILTRDPDGNEWEVFVVLENTEPVAAACGCGEKVEHAELSTELCCTPSQNASTIGATAAPCC